MKIQKYLCLLLTSSLLAGGLLGCATEEQREAKLAGQAKISKADAEKIALAKVPGGTIKESGLEKEKGKLLYSFDIATPGTRDITEVQVDAITGAILSVDKETEADEAKEKKAEK
jgi:uncharacterized membrane protein YkoI